MNTDKPITACKLWQRTSAAGRMYMSGRLGSLKVLIFENTSGEGDHTHSLLFSQAEDRPAQQQQTQSDVTASPPPARRYPARNASAPRATGKVSMADLDEPVPI